MIRIGAIVDTQCSFGRTNQLHSVEPYRVYFDCQNSSPSRIHSKKFRFMKKLCVHYYSVLQNDNDIDI